MALQIYVASCSMGIIGKPCQIVILKLLGECSSCCNSTIFSTKTKVMFDV